MMFYKFILPLMGISLLSSCAGIQNPSSYKDVVHLSIRSGQTVTSLANTVAILEKNKTVCMVSEMLLAVFPIPLELYETSPETIIFPTVFVDISRCDFPITQHPTPKEVTKAVDGVVGPILSTMSLYSVEISCKEQRITEEFLDYLSEGSFEVTREFAEPDGVLKLEGREVDLSSCKD